MKEIFINIALFVGAFVLGVITDHYINTLLFDSGSLLEQNKTALKTFSDTKAE